MLNSQNRKLVVLLILSLLVTGTVGCGGKKAKPRAKLSGLDTTPIDKPADDSNLTEEEKKAKEEADKKAAEEEATRQEEFTKIEDSFNSVVKDATQIDAKDVVEGQYTLVAVTSKFEYEKDQEERLLTLGQGEVKLELDTDKKIKSAALEDTVNMTSGIMSDDTDSGRKLDLPLSFLSSVSSEGRLQFKRDDGSAVFSILSSKSVQGGNEDSLAETLGGDDQSKSSLVSILSTGEGVKSQDEEKVSFQGKDADGKLMTVSLLQAADSSLVVKISIDEQIDNKEGVKKIRTILLNYKFTEVAKADPAAAGEGNGSTAP